MRLHTATLPVSPQYSFRATLFSHGWCSLPPFRVRKESLEVQSVITLRNGSPVSVTVQETPTGLRTRWFSRSANLSLKREITDVVGSMFRVNEDLAPFYRLARRDPASRWMAKAGAGRFLRAQTVFEDLVKTLCTTNCSWHLTTAMVKGLISEAGRPAFNDPAARAFPLPEDIAAMTERQLRKKCSMGYRAPYLLELSQRVSSGELDVEAFRPKAMDPSRTAEDLREELKNIKGIGAYAAGTMLRLLGRHDDLALDSWVRKKYFELHARGREVSDDIIHRHYESYGNWRGVFFWLEMTRHWYTGKFPDEILEE